MLKSEPGCDPPARCSVEEADLHEIRLINILDCIHFLVDGSRQGADTYRPSVVLFQYGKHQFPVDFVKAVDVDVHHGKGVHGDLAGDLPFRLDLGVVSNTPEQTICDPRRPPAPGRQLLGAFFVYDDAQNIGGLLDDDRQLTGSIEVQPVNYAETGPERGREKPGSCRRADQGKTMIMSILKSSIAG